MENKKITGNMNTMDIMVIMSEGNPGALTILMQMLKKSNGLLDILLLDSLGIRGEKIWMLYNDCSDSNMGKYYRTLMALRCGAYTQEEIQGNLVGYAIPFLDDSVKIEEVPSYDEKFGIVDEKWDEYIQANKEVVAPKIHEKIESKKVKTLVNSKSLKIITKDFFYLK